MALLSCWEARTPRLCLHAQPFESEVVVHVSKGWGCDERVVLGSGDRLYVYSSGETVWELATLKDVVLWDLVLGRAPAGTSATGPLRSDLVLPDAVLEVDIGPGFQGSGSFVVPGP